MYDRYAINLPGLRYRDISESDGVYQFRVYETCLLYTSDAADERSSVDLGGRRIIKKKKQCMTSRVPHREEDNTIQQQTINICTDTISNEREYL